MNFGFSGGTAQQHQWANEAIANCTFPLDAITANVTITWGDLPGHLDSTHPYMATVPASDGSCTIYVTSNADDPTAPFAQGLANPAKDIKREYMDGLIHELGHVVTFNTFDLGGLDTDGKITTVCELFWRSTLGGQPYTHPSGLTAHGRQGTRADWDAPGLAWADEIREAVAELFKAVFNKNVPLFPNRTNWNGPVDGSDLFKQFVKLLLPTGTGGAGPEQDLGTKTIDLRDLLPFVGSTCSGGQTWGESGWRTIFDPVETLAPIDWSTPFQPPDPALAYTFTRISVHVDIEFTINDTATPGGVWQVDSADSGMANNDVSSTWTPVELDYFEYFIGPRPEFFPLDSCGRPHIAMPSDHGAQSSAGGEGGDEVTATTYFGEYAQSYDMADPVSGDVIFPPTALSAEITGTFQAADYDLTVWSVTVHAWGFQENSDVTPPDITKRAGSGSFPFGKIDTGPLGAIGDRGGLRGALATTPQVIGRSPLAKAELAALLALEESQFAQQRGLTTPGKPSSARGALKS